MSKILKVVKKGEAWFTAPNVVLTMLKTPRFVNCGASLHGTSAEGSFSWGHRHHKGEYYGFNRRSGALATLIIGVVIVFIGSSFLLNVTFNMLIPWWEILLNLFSVRLIARAVIGMKRRR